MIRPAFIFLSVATAIFLTACESDQPPSQKEHHHPFGYTGDNGTEVAPAPDTQTPDTTPPDTVPGGGSIAPPPPPPDGNPSPSPGPNPGAPTPATGNYPYGKPVPGQPGFVMSPYSSTGYVDVRGFPPGTEVKDPYTGKIFLVP